MSNEQLASSSPPLTKDSSPNVPGSTASSIRGKKHRGSSVGGTNANGSRSLMHRVSQAKGGGSQSKRKKTAKLDTSQLKSNMAEHVEQQHYAAYLRLDLDNDGVITPGEVRAALHNQGIPPHHPQVAEAMKFLHKKEQSKKAREQGLTFDDVLAIAHNNTLVEHALSGQLVVDDFTLFKKNLETCAMNAASKGSELADSGTDGYGMNAQYIPALKNVDPKLQGIAVCTVDGQTWSRGDCETFFTVQSSCKPIAYCIALEEHGERKVHQHVGREPSGERFNKITLNPEGIPHNPCINAGAIMTASLIKPENTLAERFKHVLDVWEGLCGGERPGLSKETFEGEKATADRNYCLAYMMKEAGAFPKNANVTESLDLYFKSCSIEVTCEMMSVVAGTLANGGQCPMTGERLFTPRTVRNCLAIMSSCGMYDFSGRFAFEIALPTKSGVSGVLMIVVPGICGLATFSPRLDRYGNSVFGVNFCFELSNRFNFSVNVCGVDEETRVGMGPDKVSDGEEEKENSQDEHGVMGELKTVAPGMGKRGNSFKGRFLKGMSDNDESVRHIPSRHMSSKRARDAKEDRALKNAPSKTGTAAYDDSSTEAKDKETKRENNTEKASVAAKLDQEAQFEKASFIWGAAHGRVSQMRKLVARGVNWDSVDYDGRTAFHAAASSGQLRAVKYLIALDALHDTIDKFGGTPLVDAEREGHEEIAKLIRELDAEDELEPSSSVSPSSSFNSGSTSDSPEPQDENPFACKRSADSIEIRYRNSFAGFLKQSKYATRKVVEEILEAAGLFPRDDARTEKAITESLVPSSSLRDNEEDATAEEGGELVDLDLLHCYFILRHAIEGRMVVPDWKHFSQIVDSVYSDVLQMEFPDAKVADVVKDFTDASKRAVAICTVDGQRLARGDSRDSFTFQGISKVLTYAMALDNFGVDEVHRHVGYEPSGKRHNEIVLDEKRLPHNPYVNAGGIVSGSFVYRTNGDVASSFDAVKNLYQRGSYHAEPGFHEELFQQEFSSNDRNPCLGYMLKEANAFPDGSVPDKKSLNDVMELYFRVNSLSTNCEDLAVFAATLANGGVNPLTNEHVLSQSTVASVLACMLSSGLYRYSGEFQFQVGVPAKGGASGAILVVVPNVFGCVVWNPPLDDYRNSALGIEFCKKLGENISIHAYDNLRGMMQANAFLCGHPSDRVSTVKADPTDFEGEAHHRAVSQLAEAAFNGDLAGVRRLFGRGVDVNATDYDSRSALHVASAKGKFEVVRFLLEHGANPKLPDRWGRTALTEAQANNHTRTQLLLEQFATGKLKPVYDVTNRSLRGEKGHQQKKGLFSRLR